MRSFVFGASIALALCSVGVAGGAIRPPAPLSNVSIVMVSQAITSGAADSDQSVEAHNVGADDSESSNTSSSGPWLADEIAKIFLIVIGVSIAICVCGVLLVVLCCCGGVACIAKLCSDEQRGATQPQLQQQDLQQFPPQVYQPQHGTAPQAVLPGQYVYSPAHGEYPPQAVVGQEVQPQPSPCTAPV